MEDAFEALLDDLVLGQFVNDAHVANVFPQSRDTTGSWEIPLSKELDSFNVQETGVLEDPGKNRGSDRGTRWEQLRGHREVW